MNDVAPTVGLSAELRDAGAGRRLPLRRLTLPGGPPPDLARFLRVAIGLADALAAWHGRGLAHGALDPEVISFDPDSGEVQVTPPGATPATAIAASARALPYVAPEQTGRTGGSPDERADLYALGVILFEILTGRLPFSAKDPVGWIHCHIATAPAVARSVRRDVPQVVSDILARLLAKEPHARYQSARGLAHDLRRCLSGLTSDGDVPAFDLGGRDVAERLQLPRRLYGRAPERDTLLDAFARVRNGAGAELVLVSGPPGGGKSALVHGLALPIVRAGGRFAAGKFDQYKRDIPYATLVEACSDLVTGILGEGEVEIARWRATVRDALGATGRVITDVIPQVSLLIGPQPPVATLSPAEAGNRLRFSFQAFLGAFAQGPHALALFVDDLQWADAASLALLSDLVIGAQQPLLILGAFRDSEVDEEHPLTKAIADIRSKGGRVSELRLAPLGTDDLIDLLGDALAEPSDQRTRLAPLAELVHGKTGGNPFFALQFLATLRDEGLFRLDAAAGRWHWDLERIAQRGLTDNVIALLVEKLDRLGPGARAVLELLACLGPAGERATVHQLRAELAADLATVDAAGLSAIDSDAGLDDALAQTVAAGLLSARGETFRFVHDRVQEAAYSRISAPTRELMHARIGRMLLRSLTTEARADQLYDAVDHLNRGAAYLLGADDRALLFALNLRAGLRSKADIAFAAARGYLQRALALLPGEDPWRDQYADTFALHLALAECEGALGNVAAAESLCAPLAAHARSRAERVQVDRLRMRLCQSAGRFAESASIGLAAYAHLDLRYPDDPAAAEAALTAEVAAMRAALAERPPGARVFDPIVTDPDVRAALALLFDFMPSAYNTGAPSLPLFVFKALNLSLRYGNTEESGFAYAAAATFLVAIFDDVPTAYALAEAGLAIDRQVGPGRVAGLLSVLQAAFVHFRQKPFASSAARFDDAVAVALRVGDFVAIDSICGHVIWHAFEGGRSLADVLATADRYADLVRRLRFPLTQRLVGLYRGFLLALQGQTAGPGDLDHAGFDTAACLTAFTEVGATTGHFIHKLLATTAFTLAGSVEDAATAAQAAEALASAPGSALAAAHRFFHALALARRHPVSARGQNDEPDGAAALAATTATVAAAAKQLATWADSCPENFRSRAVLLSAELARLEGRDAEAMHLYEAAIAAAASSGIAHQEALAHDVAAAFYADRGLLRLADTCRDGARAAYARWGAHGCVAALDARLPRPIAAARHPEADAVASADVDLLAVVNASQAISGEIDRDRLVARVVEVIIMQAGAELGCLLLRREGQLAIEAEAHVRADGSVMVALLPALPVSARPLPMSIINYVVRTGTRVLIDDASQSARLAADDYVAGRRPKSLLCLPLIRQTELVGVLYLENDQLSGAFTHGRVDVLEVLAAQAAISLEHAALLARERAARTEAQEALRAREEFLTVASHELRTPMTSLTFSLQTLQGRATPGKPRPALGGMTGVVDLAWRQVERMNRLIAELLEVSRMQSGRFGLTYADVELGDLVRDVVQRFSPDLGRAGSAITIDADGPVVGRWDRARVERVCENLLSNAIKFGAGQPIHIALARGEGGARLAITDHGIGIAESEQERIFERFGRAVSEENFGGLGLGLYICRRIVTAHAGTLTVASQPGAGATFTVTLPLSPPAAA